MNNANGTSQSTFSKGKATIWIIMAIILLVGSIVCFVGREAKHEPTTIRSGYINDSGEYVQGSERTGYINGQVYVFNEEGRQLLLMVGVASLSAGLFSVWLVVQEYRRCKKLRESESRS